MKIEMADLIAALRRTLHEVIAPELVSDHARGQLAAVEDILGKLQGMTVWDPRALREQARVLRDGRDRFLARSSGLCVAAPLRAMHTDLDEADLHAVEAQIRQLTDWLDAARASLPDAVGAELDAILRKAMREQLLLDRKRIPLTDFGAMTAAGPKD